MNERRLNQFMWQWVNLERMKAMGILSSPRLLSDWMWGNSPLDDGKHAARFQDKLDNKLVLLELAQEICGGPPVHIPIVAPGRAVLLGYEVGSGRPIVIDADVFNVHGLVIGGTGMGKTTMLMRIVCELVRRFRIRVILLDHKGEGRRLLRILGDQVIVFRPDQEPWNMVEPVGHPDAYWWGFSSELGRAFNLRPETWTELPGVLKRIHANRQPSDAYRSLKDFERILKHLATVEQRQKFDTAASAIASLNHFLGKTAYIRKAPAIEDRYQVIVYEHLGLPPRIHSFLTGVRFLRLQMKSSSEGIA